MTSLLRQKIIILGSTGSIGRMTLEVVERLSHQFEIVGLAAGTNAQLLLEQAILFRPQMVAISQEKRIEPFKEEFERLKIKVLVGPGAAQKLLEEIEADIVVAAITGIESLKPTLAATRRVKRIALANKEAMVVAGQLVMEEAQRWQAEIIPIDSEHCGIFQCLRKEKKEDVSRVILTASGGPFFQTPLEELANKKVEEALAHPRWKMGKKITIDSATLMNKGLELIEARWLFNLKPEQLSILVHPQSIVHSLVELVDGSVLAQLSVTDMRLPIQFALCYPKRGERLVPSLNLSEVKQLEFFDVDEERYPLIRLAFLALEKGGSLPVALNAANEVAVDSFMKGKIAYPEIVTVIKEVIENHIWRPVATLEEIMAVDEESRERAKKIVNQRS
ncbi:MAG: 1-deoxy-D-xylulose-5-phosphate reductoisomerase [Candidatus Aminicenantes bacterium]|nr:1-deoxy-D-xylulose-5-phosphate reductoisomerase [Candidatus Aminicenantes bacterium]